MGHKDDYELYVQEQKEEALERGVAIGREEGREEGLAKGVAEEKRRNAKAMLELHVDPSIISKATGLSFEEIASL